jgi:hypothetical protein
VNLAFEGTRVVVNSWRYRAFEGCAGGRGSRHYNWPFVAIATRHVQRTKHVFSSPAFSFLSPYLVLIGLIQLEFFPKLNNSVRNLTQVRINIELIY